MSSEEIIVSISLDSKDHRVGRLWFYVRGSRESASFEYDKTWLNHPEKFTLEPALRSLIPANFTQCVKLAGIKDPRETKTKSGLPLPAPQQDPAPTPPNPIRSVAFQLSLIIPSMEAL